MWTLLENLFFVFLIIQLVLNFLRLAALSIELLDQRFTFFDIRAIRRDNGCWKRERSKTLDSGRGSGLGQPTGLFVNGLEMAGRL